MPRIPAGESQSRSRIVVQYGAHQRASSFGRLVIMQPRQCHGASVRSQGSQLVTACHFARTVPERDFTTCRRAGKRLYPLPAHAFASGSGAMNYNTLHSKIHAAKIDTVYDEKDKSATNPRFTRSLVELGRFWCPKNASFAVFPSRPVPSGGVYPSSHPEHTNDIAPR